MYSNYSVSNKTSLIENNIYELFSDIIGYYAISIISFIGIILNSFLSFILISKNLKHKFYKYILVKSIIDTIVCIFGLIYFKGICQNCLKNLRYQYIFHRWYVISINIRIVFMMSSISEIYLIINRYLIIKNIDNFCHDIKLKYYIFLIIILPILMFIPGYFGVQIDPVEIGSEFYNINLNYFGKTELYKFSTIAMLVPEIVIPILTLSTMIILTIRTYNERIQNQAEFMQTSIKRIQTLEKRFTRIAIVLTLLFVLSRTADSCLAVIIRLNGFFSITVSNKTSILNMLRQLTLFISFSMHSLSNTFIIVPIDKNLMKIIKKFLSKYLKV